MIQYQNRNGLFWLRIFGYGFYVKNIEKKGLDSSERMGCKTYVVIGVYLIGFLTPTKFFK